MLARAAPGTQLSRLDEEKMNVTGTSVEIRQRLFVEVCVQKVWFKYWLGDERWTCEGWTRRKLTQRAQASELVRQHG